MMTDAALTQLELTAALAEEIYRRSASDIPIKITDLGVQDAKIGPLSGFAANQSPDGAIFYYTVRGFVGQVVQQGNTLYVVFRGTDSAGTFTDGFTQAAASNFSETAPDPARQSDLGDFANDVLLGLGTGQQTQLDDALALTQAAKVQAAAQGLQVVVVGQSLGGGLAGLVSA
jgi:hypothetical protein